MTPLTESATLKKLAFATGDTDQLQNGAPDAIRLEDATGTVDAMSHEGSVASAVEGVGACGIDAGSDDAIARCPNGVDSQNNDSDFMLSGPTPGAENACAF